MLCMLHLLCEICWLRALSDNSVLPGTIQEAQHVYLPTDIPDVPAVHAVRAVRDVLAGLV